MPKQMDITGWREELDELRQSDAYVVGWADNEFGEVWKPVPISKIHEFAELVLSNEELRHCLSEVNKWYQEDPERTCIADDINKTYPYHGLGITTLLCKKVLTPDVSSTYLGANKCVPL